MSNLDELEAWIKAQREKESAQQTQEQANERFDRIEGAISSLADSVKGLVDKSVTDAPPVGDGEGGGAAPKREGTRPAPKSDEPPPPDYPVERVKRMDVPRIYTGDDEPESVTYIDADTGEEKTRAGRQKGKPSPWNIEVVPDEETDEGEGAAA